MVQGYFPSGIQNYAIVAYVLYLLTSFNSAAGEGVNTLIGDEYDVLALIKRLKSNNPILRQSIRCFHEEQIVEYFSKSEMVYNSQGYAGQKTVTEPYYRTVEKTTYQTYEDIPYTSCIDSTRSIDSEIKGAAIVRINLYTTLRYVDEATRSAIEKEQQYFLSKYRGRDQKYSYSFSGVLPEFTSSLTAYTQGKPAWLSSGVFYLAAVFLCGALYEYMFLQAATSVDLEIVKNIKV